MNAAPARALAAAPRGEGHAYSLAEGTLAVRAARAFVEAAVEGASAPPKPDLPKRFDAPCGVFATLSTYPDGKLRGCVGFAEPVMPLAKALKAASIAAALEDGRFAPVAPQELPGLTLEVSLLTPPHALGGATAEEVARAVVVGKHGLIVRRGRHGGLLLPQVAVDWGWAAEEFLAQTCRKAGFELDFWRTKDAQVLAFEAEVFAEKSPRGQVARVDHGAP